MDDDVVLNYEQPIKFITGFAGSGKSTRLSSMATNTTMVLVPTHKAAGVLIRKGVKNVYTIHAVLKLVPTINQDFRKGQKMQRLKQVGATDLSAITDVFIDEYSMISYEILDVLLTVLPTDTKVTIFGDPYQLPAIEGTQIDPYFYTEDIEELTIQHRAEAPEVVETFMRFMEYIKRPSNANLRLNPKILHGSLTTFNPETDRALAYTNDKVIAINNIIAKDKTFSDGDILSLNGMDCVFLDQLYAELVLYPACMSKGKIMEEPKRSKEADRYTNDIRKYNTDLSPYQTGVVEVEGQEYSIYYDIDYHNTHKRLKKAVEDAQHLVVAYHNLAPDVRVSEWCKDNRGEMHVRERGKAWSDYIAHSNLVFDLRWPYATTVHKAQGSEFDTIYLAHDDIKLSIKNDYYDTYARLMYVALSRAIKQVIII